MDPIKKKAYIYVKSNNEKKIKEQERKCKEWLKENPHYRLEKTFKDTSDYTEFKKLWFIIKPEELIVVVRLNVISRYWETLVSIFEKFNPKVRIRSLSEPDLWSLMI